jgi:hypothetical protein
VIDNGQVVTLHGPEGAPPSVVAPTESAQRMPVGFPIPYDGP